MAQPLAMGVGGPRGEPGSQELAGGLSQDRVSADLTAWPPAPPLTGSTGTATWGTRRQRGNPRDADHMGAAAAVLGAEVAFCLPGPSDASGLGLASPHEQCLPWKTEPQRCTRNLACAPAGPRACGLLGGPSAPVLPDAACVFLRSSPCPAL